jgi:hypothetical protein
MTISKMKFPREQLVLKTCGNKLPYGRSFIWNNDNVTKIKVTIDNTDDISTFLETIHIYFLNVEIKKYELRYSLMRMTFDQDGIIDNIDLARWNDLIIDAKCDGPINLLEAHIISLINELHPSSVNPKFEVYTVKSPSQGGE